MQSFSSDIQTLAQDIELIRLRLLGAFSPRAAAGRLRKVHSRLHEVGRALGHRLEDMATAPESREAEVKSNGHPPTDLPAQSSLLI